MPSILGQAKRSFWLFFGGIWLIAGLIMIVIAIGMAFQERAFSEAVRTSGIVLAKDIIPADSDTSTQYRVRFRFTTSQGAEVEADQNVDVAQWEGLVERDPIDVYYLPSSPSSARLQPGANLFLPVIFLLFGAVFGGIGGVLFGRALRGLVRARRVLESGVDAQATVTAVEQTNVTLNRRPQFRVRYRYDDAAGVAHLGDSGHMDWEAALSWKEGDRVAIRYNPQRPAESLWVGAIEAAPPAPDAPPPAVDAPPPPS